MAWTIYFLSDPADPTAGYVGQTKRSAALRFRQHLSQARAGHHAAVYGWLRTVIAAGHLPECTTLASCNTLAEANRLEREWIQRKHFDGIALANRTDGGQGPYGPTFGARIAEACARPQTRARKAEAGRQVAGATWSDPEIHARRTAGIRAAWADPDKRAARMAKLAEVRNDPERRATWDANHKAGVNTASVRERRSAISSSYANRPEVRARVAAQAKERWADHQYRAMVQERMRGARQRKRDAA